MLVTEIQKFCTHDGPGVRTVVFLKGCPLHCLWCHNPETQSACQQLFYTAQHCILCGGCVEICPARCHTINGEQHVWDASACIGCGKCASVCPTGACEPAAKEMTVTEIVDAVLRDSAFYGETGGVTLSGGEPLMHPQAVEILQRCKEAGIHTAVETCGYVNRDLLEKAAEVTDLFLWDIKGGNRERHFENTGVYPEKVLDNLLFVDCAGKETVLRCIIVQGRNTFDDDTAYIADVYHRLKHCCGAEILPYHAYGASKAVQLGMADNGRKEWIPSPETIAAIAKKLTDYGVKVLEVNG